MMSQFEYVSVLTSLILGLGITQILINVSDLILLYERIKFYALHTIWVFLIFGFHIQEWWINFQYSRVIMDWSLISFFFLVSYPIVLFIIARLLFPVDLQGGDVDLKDFFFRNMRKIFAAGVFLPLISIPQNILIGYSFSDQIVQILLACIFLFIAITNTRNKVLHYTFSIGMLLVSIFYMIYLNPVL